jgi:hypothetical protein
MSSASSGNTRLRAFGPAATSCRAGTRRGARHGAIDVGLSPAAIAPSERPVAGLMLSKVAPLAAHERAVDEYPERGLSAGALAPLRAVGLRKLMRTWLARTSAGWRPR